MKRRIGRWAAAVLVLAAAGSGWGAQVFPIVTNNVNGQVQAFSVAWDGTNYMIVAGLLSANGRFAAVCTLGRGFINNDLPGTQVWGAFIPSGFPVFQNAACLGAAGTDVGGTGIKCHGGAVYVCGNNVAAGGVIARYNTPLSSGAAPVWSLNWPGAYAYGGMESLFALTRAVENGTPYIYAAGLGQPNGSINDLSSPWIYHLQHGCGNPGRVPRRDGQARGGAVEEMIRVE